MTKHTTKHSHAARFCLPLLLALGGAAHAQFTNRPPAPSPISKPPVVAQPVSEMKIVTTVNHSMDSAPAEQMQKAFRSATGRDAVRGELQAATKFILKGTTYNCIPPSKIAEFDPPP